MTATSTKQLAWYIFGVFASIAAISRFVSYDAPSARELGSAIRFLSVLAAVVSGVVAVVITQLRPDHSIRRSALIHVLFVFGALVATFAGVVFVLST